MGISRRARGLEAGSSRRKFVVTGTGRSGTLYTSRVLRQYGIRCGHENVFTVDSPGFSSWGSYDGDCSWLVVPFLSELPAETLIIHQVREPLKTIRSLASDGMFQTFNPRRYLLRPIVRKLMGRRQSLAFDRYIRRFSKEAMAEPDVFSRAARHWVEWNEQVEDSSVSHNLEYFRVRVEDLNSVGGIEQVLKAIGVQPSSPISRPPPVSTSTHAKKRLFDHMAIENLPRPLQDSVTKLQRRYGYQGSLTTS